MIDFSYFALTLSYFPWYYTSFIIGLHSFIRECETVFLLPPYTIQPFQRRNLKAEYNTEVEHYNHFCKVSVSERVLSKVVILFRLFKNAKSFQQKVIMRHNFLTKDLCKPCCRSGSNQSMLWHLLNVILS